MDNDASCKVIEMGSIKFKIFDRVVRAVQDVRHVTELRMNLISLSTLNINGYSYKSECRTLK